MIVPPIASAAIDLSITERQATGKMAGWVARTRPLTGPLSPRGPQPTVHHPKEVNDGPPWLDGHIQEVRVFSTDALGYVPTPQLTDLGPD
jgi:hypothetical protein